MSGANSQLSYPHHKREIKRRLSKAATLAGYVGNMFALFTILYAVASKQDPEQDSEQDSKQDSNLMVNML
jgi:hypothetical protein